LLNFPSSSVFALEACNHRPKSWTDIDPDARVCLFLALAPTNEPQHLATQSIASLKRLIL
jgi:hypothetical protein